MEIEKRHTPGMLAYTYVDKGHFELRCKDVPSLQDDGDAIVKVTLGSICTSDLHIMHGSVPRAVPGITVGHEMVGIVTQTGPDVHKVKPGDRVAVNVETFCGKCFFCRHGYVNNCTDPNGGWALGCRIDGGQAENLIFKTGGVDGCDCDEILRLISQGLLDTTPLITHRFPLNQIDTAYRIFENREDGVIKIAVTPPEKRSQK